MFFVESSYVVCLLSVYIRKLIHCKFTRSCIVIVNEMYPSSNCLNWNWLLFGFGFYSKIPRCFSFTLCTSLGIEDCLLMVFRFSPHFYQHQRQQQYLWWHWQVSGLLAKDWQYRTGTVWYQFQVPYSSSWGQQISVCNRFQLPTPHVNTL